MGWTTAYLAGVLDVDTQNGAPLAARTLYGFNGQIVAERNSTDGSVVYLHGDHFGSVSLTSARAGPC